MENKHEELRYRCVMSLHGIRTRGAWQHYLVPILARAGFVPVPLDYGAFGAAELLMPWRRAEKVAWFLGEYERVLVENEVERPSIIAHSFGSYIVAEALDKHPHMRFDKIILCGSIVHEDFDWETKLATGQVNFVRNDYGALDVWPRIARALVGGAGRSGTDGFARACAGLAQIRFGRYTHSDYFHSIHMRRHWLPTLRPDCASLLKVLRYVTGYVRSEINADADKVRACIYVLDPDQQLFVLPGLSLNMTDAGELACVVSVANPQAIPTPGVAEAFRTGNPSIGLFFRDWETELLDASLTIRPNPELKFSICLPLLDEEGTPHGVLVVDSLSFAKSASQVEEMAAELITAADWAASALIA